MKNKKELSEAEKRGQEMIDSFNESVRKNRTAGVKKFIVASIKDSADSLNPIMNGMFEKLGTFEKAGTFTIDDAKDIISDAMEMQSHIKNIAMYEMFMDDVEFIDKAGK